MTLPAIPSAATLTTPDQIRHLGATLVEWADAIEDPHAVKETADRWAAITEYVRRQSSEGIALAEATLRRLELRVGALIGPARSDHDRTPGSSSVVTDVGRQARTDFRRMAAHPHIVEQVIAESTDEDPPSRRKILKAIKRATAADLPPVDTPTTGTTYTTIIIDPPWRYDNVATRGAAEDHYPTMSLNELVELIIPAAPNSHLYLWVTNGFIRQGFDLLDQWGFTYKTTLTWVKPQIGMGNWFRNATEHVLFAVRGQLPTNANNIPTWFQADRTRHSAKPESFYDIVEKSSPGPWLEMFARRRRIGWETWGNEA